MQGLEPICVGCSNVRPASQQRFHRRRVALARCAVQGPAVTVCGVAVCCRAALHDRVLPSCARLLLPQQLLLALLMLMLMLAAAGAGAADADAAGGACAGLLLLLWVHPLVGSKRPPRRLRSALAAPACPGRLRAVVRDLI